MAPSRAKGTTAKQPRATGSTASPAPPAPSASSGAAQDVEMADVDEPAASHIEDGAAAHEEGGQEQEEDAADPAVMAMGEQRIRLLPGSSDTAASFEFKNEDHTLGNALRYIIMKNPDVEFCGYSIPHPSEPLMNIRIQTWNGTATEALEKGFNDLMELCDVVTEKFESARSSYHATVTAKS